MPVTEVYESMQRHMNAFMGGEDCDEESGLPHLGHAMCNLMFLSNYMTHRPQFDDRYKDGGRPTGDLPRSRIPNTKGTKTEGT